MKSALEVCTMGGNKGKYGCFSTVGRVGEELNLTLKTTYNIYTTTTLKAEAVVFRWTQMKLRHLLFLNRISKAADCSQLGYWHLPSPQLPIGLSHELVRNSMIRRRNSEERKGG